LKSIRSFVVDGGVGADTVIAGGGAEAIAADTAVATAVAMSSDVGAGVVAAAGAGAPPGGVVVAVAGAGVLATNPAGESVMSVPHSR